MFTRRLYMTLFAVLLVASIPPRNGASAEPLAGNDLNGAPLPPGASARLGSVPWRMSDAINQMAFIPAGRYLATKSTYETMNSNRSLAVWDLQSGRVVRTISSNGTPEGEGFADGFTLTPDGKLLFSADERGKRVIGGLSGDPRTTSRLHLWDFSSGKLLLRSPDLGEVPYHLAIQPYGRVAAYATRYGNVGLWDLQKNVVRRLRVGENLTMIHSICFSRDGKHLIVLPSEGEVSRRIDVATGKTLKMVTLGDCGSVALAPHGGTIATYTHPDQLHLYDTLSGAKRRLPLKNKVEFLHLSFSPDGRTLLAMDRSAEVVQFWDVAKGHLLRRLSVRGLASTDGHAELLLSANGEWLASYDEYHEDRFSEAVVRIWDARTGQPQMRLPRHISPPVQLAFSANGKEVVSYAYRENSPGGQLHRWDIATSKLLTSVFPDTPKEVKDEAPQDWLLAPGGQHLAGRIGRAIYLYEVGTGRRLMLTDKVFPASDWSFTPDGRAVVTIIGDPVVHLWDVTSGKHLHRLELEKRSWLTSGLQSTKMIRFTPDGKTLVEGEGWQKVHLRAGASGKLRATLKARADREPNPERLGRWETAFTPDGRYLFASSTTNLWIWDLVAGKEIGPFEQDQNEWRRTTGSGRVAVSPDGRFMAWFDQLWKLRLYEIATGKIVHRFEKDYSSIAFAPFGWHLATGCKADASILIWDLPLLFRSQPLSSKATSAEELWGILASDDVVQAYRALWRLAAMTEAETFLARHLKPVESVPPERLRALLANLGSTDFATREKAEQTLAAAGEPVRAAVAEALAGTKDPEVRRRMLSIQERVQPHSPERLRELRALLILESRDTAEARRLLKRLATGQPEARLTQEVKAVLDRLARCSGSKKG